MSTSFIAVMTSQGRQARRQGKSRNDCPYSEGTSAQKHWLEGFQTASIKVDPKYAEIPALAMKSGPWDPRERKLLEKLYLENNTIAAISKILERGEKAVSNQISQMGLTALRKFNR